MFSTALTIEKNKTSYPLHFYSGFQYDVDIGSNIDDPRLDNFQYLFSLTATTTDSGGKTHHGQITQVPGKQHGTFIYTPDEGYVGQDYVFYFVYDEQGKRSGRGDVIFNVEDNHINLAPITFDYKIIMPQDTVSTAIHFRTGMQYDPEAAKVPSLLDLFTYQFVDSSNSTNGKTANGTIAQAEGKAHGIFIYTPDEGFVGTEQVNFWVTDDKGLQSAQGIMTYVVERNVKILFITTELLGTSVSQGVPQ